MKNEVNMKKISKFLSNHYFLNIFIFIFMLILSSVLLVGSHLKVISAVPFVCFLIGSVRFFQYHHSLYGKLPGRDYIYDYWKSRYGKEEADRKYTESSLKISTYSWIVGMISFAVAAIVEILYWI